LFPNKLKEKVNKQSKELELKMQPFRRKGREFFPLVPIKHTAANHLPLDGEFTCEATYLENLFVQDY